MKPGPRFILLVEDDPDDANLVAEALKAVHAEATLAVRENGARALDFLRRKPPQENAARPDLILLDHNMPVMTGSEFLREMKRDANLRQIPVIVLTNSVNEDDVFRAYDLGANAYLTKPIGFNEFVDMIKCLRDFWLNLSRLPSATKSLPQ